jgi:hypothetical protein
MREVLFIALALACPLMMIFMMRGHGHGSSAGGQSGRHGGHNEELGSTASSAEELRRRRDELDRLIAEREDAEERATSLKSGGPR